VTSHYTTGDRPHPHLATVLSKSNSNSQSNSNTKKRLTWQLIITDLWLEAGPVAVKLSTDCIGKTKQQRSSAVQCHQYTDNMTDWWLEAGPVAVKLVLCQQQSSMTCNMPAS
jgi:hypothetical protein